MHSACTERIHSHGLFISINGDMPHRAVLTFCRKRSFFSTLRHSFFSASHGASFTLVIVLSEPPANARMVVLVSCFGLFGVQGLVQLWSYHTCSQFGFHTS
ncbi:hypothetical protein CY34DRAFT_600438 [Suillus luteus UH-Slu-Lm8-n1]|uniref:Uncharacterized protein n=1 Tax=Suillus luteus UH-Slu-Lm8-n1 TaxID=930992 RepID=A0A0D0ALE8_9AGAM|nr:hypothetical protein CY34DRAFT_600438 [Suillus luteus UH-Slu-Lm8-n1]